MPASVIQSHTHTHRERERERTSHVQLLIATLFYSTFCHKFLADLGRKQMEELDIIFNEHDNEWDMFNWLTGKEVCSLFS